MEHETSNNESSAARLGKKVLLGVVSVLLCNLPVFTLKNSPITSALETELLRWRFEIMHSVTKPETSRDIVVVYVRGSSDKTMQGKTDQSLNNILLKIESAQPKVVGLVFSPEQFRSQELNETISSFANIIACRQSEPKLANCLNIAPFSSDETVDSTNDGKDTLYVESNGMASQIPTSLATLADGSKQRFNTAVVAAYRKANEQTTTNHEHQGERFINYANLNFDTLDGAKLFDPHFDTARLKNKIVLLGNFNPRYTIPREELHIHTVKAGSEVLVQAFAIQSLLDRTSIAPSSSLIFRTMLKVLVLVEFLMPIVGHVTRISLFLTSTAALFATSYLTLHQQHVFIQIWPFLVGLVGSFLFGTVIFTFNDLKTHNKNLKLIQNNLENRNAELEQAKKDLENTGKEIATARELGMEEERKRVALDLHDDALKELFLASSAVESSVHDGLNPVLAKQVQTKIHEASEKIRRIMANLSPSTLAVCGLSGAIESLTCTLREESGMDVTFSGDVGSALDTLDEKHALLIYRIVQEAFNNIQKHSRATKVLVTVSVENSTLKIAIGDNGVGLDKRPDDAQGYGLNSMKYRADLIGAQLNVGNCAEFDTGTQVTLSYQIRS